MTAKYCYIVKFKAHYGAYPHCSGGEGTSQIRTGARKQTNLGRTRMGEMHLDVAVFTETSSIFCLDLGKEAFFLKLLRQRCAK